MKTTNVYLKESNLQKIKAFATQGAKAESLQGMSLKALYTLIQKKGETVETEDKKLKGLKALYISDTELIAIKRVGVNENFYPCMMQTYLLTHTN